MEREIDKEREGGAERGETGKSLSKQKKSEYVHSLRSEF